MKKDRKIEKIYSLTPMQEGMLFHALKDIEEDFYFEQYLFTLEGTINRELLEESFNRLIKRHDILRTLFVYDKLQKPKQVVVENLSLEILFEDISHLSENEQKQYLEDFKIKDRARGFDLTRDLLMRVFLFNAGPGVYKLLWSSHHITMDGWSSGIFIKELIRVYLALKRGESPRLMPVVPFRNYIKWLEKQDKEEGLRYWKNYLDGYERQVGLPLMDSPPAGAAFELEQYISRFDEELTSGLARIAAGHKVTVNTVFQTLWGVLLQKYNNTRDIVFGTVVSGRPPEIDGIEDIIGLFINAVPVRIKSAAGQSFSALLAEVHEQAALSASYEYLPLADVQGQSVLKRELISHLVTFENYPVEERMKETGNVREIGFKIRDIDLFDQIHYNFDIIVIPGESLMVKYSYNGRVYTHDYIKQVDGHFRRLIKQVVQSPDVHLDHIDILPDEEKKQLLVDFNDTAAPYPKDKTIHELFEEQVNRTPGNTAVTFDAESLTYRQLNEKADQLANYLHREKQIQPGAPVGILMDRNIGHIIAVLGILKAGGAYVPIYSSWPEQRIKHLIVDAAIEVIISQRSHLKLLNRLQWECPTFHSFLCMDTQNNYSVMAVGNDQMKGEKELWNYIGEKAVDDITGGGWLTSYTGEPFTKEEMDEYGDNILKKLLPLLRKDMRVLEIGCASGISMYRIAPHVGFYYGTDLSSVIIEKNKRRCREENITNIALACVPAHLIDTIEERDFDLVIINSVIQDFQEHNYLRKVLRKSIDMLSDSGYLFVGDVMDQDLKESLISEMVEFKEVHRGRGYTTKTDFSSELFVSRGFFEDLKTEYAAVRSVEFSGKIFTMENELTKFRYDTLVTIDKTALPVDGDGRGKNKYQDDLSTLGKYDTVSPGLQVLPVNPAYVIYTSGTTGKPNGVVVEHRSVVNLLTWFSRTFHVGVGTHVLQLTDYSFDPSVEEVLGTLLYGGVVYAIDRDLTADIDSFCDFVDAHRIHILNYVPSLLEHLLCHDRKLESIRVVIAGGEPLKESVKNRIIERGYVLYNNYGPTEITVDALSGRCGEAPVNLGKPAANTCAYILDNDKNLLPVGAAGELYIAGDGIAAGYLNNPQLTAERFVDFNRTYRSYKSYKSYRTGDLARWLPDGNIEFLGRVDQQVKLRGFRVELKEIENRLLDHPRVKEAVVAVKGDDERKHLCAYYVGSDGETLDAELQSHLEQKLPDYMVPAYFVQLEHIPLTSGGKTDRKALPDPEVKKGEGHVAPRNDVEKKLVEIWSEVLAVDKKVIGIDDGFFEIGGHSLKATILVSRIHKELNVRIPLKEIFGAPTIREISRRLKGAEEEVYTGIQNVEEKEYYPLSYNQKRLWVLHLLDPNSPSYHMPGLIPLDHNVDTAALEKTLSLIFQRHESFRTSFKNVGDTAFQFIEKTVDIPFEVIDISALPAQERQAKKDALYLEVVRTPFDLSRAPLFRSLLVKSGETAYDVMFNMHHIISDGWSHEVLRKEFISFYDAFSTGKTVNPAPLKLQYKDFAHRQNRRIADPRIKEQSHRFWKEQLQNGVPKLQLPVVPGMNKNDREGAVCTGMVNDETLLKLRQIAETNNTTLFTVIFSLYVLLLSRFADRENRQDIMCSIINAGRDHEALTDVVGFFVNAVLFKTPVDYEEPFNRFLGRVHNGVLEAFQHQAYPLELVCDDLKMRYPDIPVSFNMLNLGDTHNMERPGIDESPQIPDISDIKFDIELYVAQYKNALDIIWTYRKNMFSPDSIDFLLREYIKLVEFFASNPGKNYKALKLAKKKETIWE